MSDIYEDGTYLDHNPSWHEEDSLWKAGQIQEIIKRNELTPAKTGEVGCGAGEILNQLSFEYGEGVEFYGYEISPQAFALCKKNLRKTCTSS